MLNWLKERHDRGRTARELYGSIVTQARLAPFYALLGVPDTPRGRFELIVLHTALVMQRLQQEGPEGIALARTLGETFVTDMDDNMRELSFSDLAVPREVKKIAAALYDRHKSIAAALDAVPADSDPLAEALARQLAYLQPEGASGIDTKRLARYTRDAAAALSRQDAALLASSGPAWPMTIEK